MGSGASALTPEQSGELARLMKIEYENSTGTDDEISLKLTEKYNELFTKVLISSASLSTPLSVNSTPMKMKAPSAAKPAGPASPRTKPNARRRSFGGNSKANAELNNIKKEIQSALINDSETSQQVDASVQEPKEPVSTLVPAATEEPQPPMNQDCWDSVSEQPFCVVCAMAFKTKSAYQRHVQYSDLHAKQVAKMGGNAGQDSTGMKKLELESQVEGVHYNLLYSGNKLFWKTGDSIDFHIYAHNIAKVVEIIGLDPVKDKELNRIYLDYDKLTLCVEPLVLEAMQRKRAELSDGGKIALPNTADARVKESLLRDEARQMSISTFLLKRLQLLPSSDFNPQTSLDFVLFTFDDTNINPILKGPPPTLVPVSVNRRRKSTSDDIAKTLMAVEQDNLQLKMLTQRAEQVGY